MTISSHLPAALLATLLLTLLFPAAQASETELKALRSRLAALEAEHRALQKREAELLEEVERLRATTLADSPPVSTPPSRLWESNLAFGASYNSGNTESSLVTMTFAATRKRQDDQLALKLDGQYGQTQSVRSAERILGSAQYDRDFTPDAYWLARVTAEHDAVKDLDYRFTAGPGIGYRMINRDHLLLAWETGPGFQFESVAGNDAFFPQWRGAQKFEWQINRRFKVFESAELLLNPLDFNERNAIVSLGLESSLTERLALRLVAQDRYQFNVPADRKRHDFSLTTSVVWNF
ncbi:MAG: DUF481 domain-containing protein [Verrucomicrobiia bacterium]